MNPDDPRTFGGAISQKRKQLGLSQKQLAARIQREEGGQISPQYLNDIEHDRRNPSSDHIIGEFARELSLKPDYLYVLAGRIPTRLRDLTFSEQQVDRLVAAAYRRGTSGRR
ncbi:MAG TPA: helix-turn-helix transcriptional regulator [Stellaceae bacterium]|nr:helix-turn-helix transcriptional regulator [Stellaceae bacterium]